MVSGDVDDLRALMCLSEQFVKNLVHRFRPVPSFVQFPPVDHIADKVERLRFRFAQKIEKGGGIEVFGADVKIGQEDGTEDLRLCVCSVRQARPRNDRFRWTDSIRFRAFEKD